MCASPIVQGPTAASHIQRPASPFRAAEEPIRRTVHLVDVENLCGTGLPDTATAVDRMSLYADASGLKDGDFGFAAANKHVERRLSHDLPKGLRWILAGTGPDAADRALLECADLELYARRYDRVVIGSGDGAFAGMASALVDAGLEVEVVAAEGSVSSRLSNAASTVTLIPAA